MSFSRFVFTSFLLTALSVPVHSVFAQEPIETGPEAVGEYLLIRANAQELPALVSRSGTRRQEVIGGSVRLEADGTHVWVTRYRYTDGAVVNVSESSGRGSYSQEGASITILFEAGGCCEGILDGNTLTIQIDVPMVYRKIFGQVPTEAFSVPNRGGENLPLPPPAPPQPRYVRPVNYARLSARVPPGTVRLFDIDSRSPCSSYSGSKTESRLSTRHRARSERSRPIFRYLETDAILVVRQVLKGPESIRQVVISQKGGVLGRYTELPIQYDLVEEEEQYILFLTDETRPDLPDVTGSPRYALNGSWTGMFQIDESPRPLEPGCSRFNT